MSEELEEGLSSEHLRRHVIRIAEKMDEPWKWKLSHIDCCDDDEVDHCVCGARIKWRFFIEHIEEPGRQLKIGSTCIEATVPWLISMNADALATAIRTQWAQVVAEIRRARLIDQGLKKLKPTLALAAALDRWFWELVEAAKIKSWDMPEYWQEYSESPSKRLLAARGDTPARQAASLLRRIGNFRDRVPLLREAVHKIGKERCWSDPPTAGDHDVDAWYEAWLAANSLRDTLKEFRASRGKVLKNACPEYYERLSTALNTHLPAATSELRAWIAGASMLLSSAPTEEQIAAAEVRQAHLAKVGEAKRRLAQAEAELTRLRGLPAEHCKLMLSGKLKKLRLRRRVNEKRHTYEYTARIGNTIYKLAYGGLRGELVCLCRIGEPVFDNGHITIVLVTATEEYDRIPERIAEQVAEVTRLKTELAALNR